MVKTVDEFKGINPKDVRSYIEGEPFINIIPVEPGLTNGIIVMIGLSEELPGHEEKYELHRLLGALLSQNLAVDEKQIEDIIKNAELLPV